MGSQIRKDIIQAIELKGVFELRFKSGKSVEAILAKLYYEDGLEWLGGYEMDRYRFFHKMRMWRVCDINSVIQIEFLDEPLIPVLAYASFYRLQTLVVANGKQLMPDRCWSGELPLVMMDTSVSEQELGEVALRICDKSWCFTGGDFFSELSKTTHHNSWFEFEKNAIFVSVKMEEKLIVIVPHRRLSGHGYKQLRSTSISRNAPPIKIGKLINLAFDECE